MADEADDRERVVKFGIEYIHVQSLDNPIIVAQFLVLLDGQREGTKPFASISASVQIRHPEQYAKWQEWCQSMVEVYTRAIIEKTNATKVRDLRQSPQG